MIVKRQSCPREMANQIYSLCHESGSGLVTQCCAEYSPEEFFITVATFHMRLDSQLRRNVTPEFDAYGAVLRFWLEFDGE